MAKSRVNARVIKATQSIQTGRAFQSEQETHDSFFRDHGLVEPPYNQSELYSLVDYSTILGQCIEAYKRNIPGFGAEPQYIDDLTSVTETEEMKREFQLVKTFIKYFNFDKSFEEVAADIIDDRERTGNGYLEVIRDGTGLVAGGQRIDPRAMYLTKLGDPVMVKQFIEGATINRPRRFRKFAQRLTSGRIIWFKEFGDPRNMNSKTGEYTSQHNGPEEATEVIHFKIGNEIYGIPRYIGQLIHMYGARKAEELNYNYFYKGRHTPAAIIVSNGILTEDSVQALEEYAKSVEGVDNAHKFLLIEAEGIENGVIPGEEKSTGVKVELKSIADMLQKDALFIDYDESSRRKVQSAFRLPDIYVGRSKEYNRSTAETSRSLTEEQVFEPERGSLEWVINNKLLADFQLKHVRVNFKTPEISNNDEKAKLIEVLAKYGGIAPNDLRDLAGRVLGKDLENFEVSEADLPLVISQLIKALQTPALGFAAPQTRNQEEETQEGEPSMAEIVKRVGEHEAREIINLLKDIKDEVEEYGKTSSTT